MENISILQQLQKLHESETQLEERLPKPNFLYISRFGRTLDKEMDEITAEIGRKGWFSFRADSAFHKDGILRDFQMELERRAELGRGFAGCVLVELSEGFLEEEGAEEFLEYLKEREEQLYYVFIIKSKGQSAWIKKLLEQYFFVREVLAEQFGSAELARNFKEALAEYGLCVEKGAEDVLTEFLAGKEWEQSDCVPQLVENMARNIAYGRMLEAQSEGREITKKELSEWIEKEKSQNVKKVQIGFQL